MNALAARARARCLSLLIGVSPLSVATMLGAGPVGCSAHHQAKAPAPRPPERAWFDRLVDDKRDFVFAISPRELTRDPVFGSLVRRAMDAALEHARSRGASASALEAVLRAEDLVVAVRDREGRDAVAILSGVPSDLQPEAILDDAGRPIFHLGNSSPRMRVFTPTLPDRRARLFELPGGTWVLGVGDGVDRTDAILKSSESLAYAPKLHSPATARFAGELLTSLKERAGAGLRPVVRGLENATMTLARDPEVPTRARLRLELAYRPGTFAEESEPTATRAVELLSKRFDIPITPRTGREGTTVWLEVAFESGAADPERAAEGASDAGPAREGDAAADRARAKH